MVTSHLQIYSLSMSAGTCVGGTLCHCMPLPPQSCSAGDNGISGTECPSTCFCTCTSAVEMSRHRTCNHIDSIISVQNQNRIR
eukprot:jgi/Botrbrau1/11340/Bobra.0038s0099.1